MMNTFGKMLLAGGTVLLIGGGLAACSHHNMGPEEKAEWMVRKIDRELDLNEAQMRSLQAFKEKALQVHQEMHADKEQKFSELLAVVQAPVLDQQALLAMLQSHTEDMNRVAPELLASLAEVMDSLDAEQKKKLVAHLEDKRAHWQRHHN